MSPAPQEPVAPTPPDSSAQGPGKLAHVLEQMTSEPGATLFIAHPLTPERQKELADLLLAGERKEAADTIQHLREDLERLENDLKQRLADLAGLNDDLENSLRATNTPVIVLGNDLHIRRYSPSAAQLLNMSPDSIGMDIATAKLAVNIPGLQDIVMKVMTTLETHRQEVSDEPGRWFRLHVSPYRTVDGRTDGAVLTFQDIDADKRSEQLLRSYQMKEQQYHEVLRGCVVVLDVHGTVMMINRNGCELLGVAETDIRGTKWFDTFVARNHAEAARLSFERCIAGEPVHEDEYPVRTSGGEERLISWRFALLKDHMENVAGMICSGEDRTSLRQAIVALQKSEQRFRLFMENTRDDEFFITDPEGYISTWVARHETAKSYEAKDMVGQHFSRLFSPEDFQSGKPMRILDLAETNGRHEEEGWRIRRDGSKMKAHAVTMPVYDESGKLVGFSHVTRFVAGQREKDTIESSFASLHGYPLREGQ